MLTIELEKAFSSLTKPMADLSVDFITYQLFCLNFCKLMLTAFLFEFLHTFVNLIRLKLKEGEPEVVGLPRDPGQLPAGAAVRP